jgi:lysophospholipase L1-like esterase
VADARRGPAARARRWLGGFLPGAATRRAQVLAYAQSWTEVNLAALAATGPLWVALGDSVSQGVGASAFDRGYVGRLLERLRRERDPSFRVVNLSVSGARVADVISGQLPRLDELAPADMVTCAVGANDLVQRRWDRLDEDIRRLAARLPTGAVLATLPQGLQESVAERTNQVLVAEARSAGLVVADVWGRTGRPWAGKFAADHFHPSDAGHADWAAAFAVAMGLDDAGGSQGAGG